MAARTPLCATNGRTSARNATPAGGARSPARWRRCHEPAFLPSRRADSRTDRDIVDPARYAGRTDRLAGSNEPAGVLVRPAAGRMGAGACRRRQAAVCRRARGAPAAARRLARHRPAPPSSHRLDRSGNPDRMAHYTSRIILFSSRPLLSAPSKSVRTRLFAGGRWIRTLGPPTGGSIFHGGKRALSLTHLTTRSEIVHQAKSG